MEVFGQALLAGIRVMQIPFTLYGFTFNLWQIYFWTGFAAIILFIIFSIWRH